MHSFLKNLWKNILGLMPKSISPCSCSHHKEHEEWQLMALLASGCFVFGLIGLLLDIYFKNPATAIVFYFLAYLAGGWDAAIDTWASLKKRKLEIHFLMLSVALGAASIGAWREGALLLFLFSASGAMEHFAMGRTKKAIDALFRGAPKTARVLRDGKEEQIPLEQLLAGMHVLVTSGEQIPADLEIIKGESSCDESNLTGEATPVKKVTGDIVLSGTINLWGVLEGRVLRPASESSLQKIIRLIQTAQGLKAPSQRFTDRFGSHYTLLVLSVCTVMFFVWWLVFKKPAFLSTNDIDSAFYRTMTLLVVASPCALVLSVPSAILSAIASGARRGILYRGGAAIETLADVRIVALDKTGTLTSGNLTLIAFDCFEGEELFLKSVAWSLARLSEHPLSRAIRRTGNSWNTELTDVEKVETVPGSGLRATIHGKPYLMGSRRFIETFRTIPQEALSDTALNNGAVVWIAGHQSLGRIFFSDEIRKESRLTLDQLHREGIQTVMLTGDHSEAAEIIGKQVGIGKIMSGLSPKEKVQAIQDLKQGNKVRVAMIGDGVNDAPCIAAADVGIAMGARGSDAALEQAEIVLMNDRIENFLLARILSQHARAIIYQNIFVAMATVIIMVTTAFLMPISLTLGVIAHEGSTLLVVLNSLRLLKTKLPKQLLAPSFGEQA